MATLLSKNEHLAYFVRSFVGTEDQVKIHKGMFFVTALYAHEAAGWKERGIMLPEQLAPYAFGYTKYGPLERTYHHARKADSSYAVDCPDFPVAFDIEPEAEAAFLGIVEAMQDVLRECRDSSAFGLAEFAKHKLKPFHLATGEPIPESVLAEVRIQDVSG